MSQRQLVPIAELAQGRPQEHGKLKSGIKLEVRGKPNSPPRPATTPTWRFVTPDHEVAAQLAEKYGISTRHKPCPEAKMGEIFIDDRGQSDFVSAAEEIDIALPPYDPLGGTPIYELWSGGGCLRRCTGGDGPEACNLRFSKETGEDTDVWYEPAACQCLAQQNVVCKPTTRLSVLLPGIRVGGVWSFSSTSYDVAREFQQMIGILEMAAVQGFKIAKARLVSRQKTTPRGKRKYTVPILIFPGTLGELVTGTGAAAELAMPTAGALPAAATAALPAAGETNGGDPNSPATAEQREIVARLWSSLPTEVQELFKTEFAEQLLKPTRSTSDEMAGWLQAQVDVNEAPFS